VVSTSTWCVCRPVSTRTPINVLPCPSLPSLTPRVPIQLPQDTYSDGLPVYSLTGAAVPTWLKRVKWGRGRFWVIGQSTGYLYAARVDCLTAIRERRAKEERLAVRI